MNVLLSSPGKSVTNFSEKTELSVIAPAANYVVVMMMSQEELSQHQTILRTFVRGYKVTQQELFLINKTQQPFPLDTSGRKCL
jgi:hypothetical protein